MDPRLLRRNKQLDTLARHVITVGGVAVIFSVIAILFLIFKVTIPLFKPASVKPLYTFSHQDQPENILALGLDDYQENIFTINRQGQLHFQSLPVGSHDSLIDLGSGVGSSVKDLAVVGPDRFSLLWADDTVSLVKIDFLPQFDSQGKRTIVPSADIVEVLPAPALASPVVSSRCRQDSEGRLIRVNHHADNSFSIFQRTSSEDLFGEETVSELSSAINPYFEQISAFAVSSDGRILFAGTMGGTLLRWDIGEDIVLTDTVPAFKEPITAMTMVFGSQSLAIGTDSGTLSTWMGVRDSAVSETKKLRKIHKLKTHDSAVTTIFASQRDKSLISLDRQGILHLDHMTSERHLLNMPGSHLLAALSGRGSGLVTLDNLGTLQVNTLLNPHPEVSLKTLFGQVWYENYDSPDYVWQSSAGSDDFEAKFSITPLLFGTIKGTFYAMIFALPLATFGAVYVSQFAPPHLQRIIKPLVEVMASVPSVVIGFLIALVLAPLIEAQIVPLLLSFLFLPGGFLIFIACWQFAQRFTLIRELRHGYEFILVLPVLVLSAYLCYLFGPLVEKLLFGGNFSQFLFQNTGTRYDQRNCIIIAFGLGFTVIPIIFSIAEDSLSNVPPNLTAASMALGASRWQTVWRVILPSASPGIFAGAMIGLGRAVGETMIVLMATGNTPIMDLSIFNGMRTLSANIAVEIPEAPVDSTLYRVLFLCAVLLFIMTFMVNTGAELVRERLRKKYARY
ncbi:MAG: ABC transporter permease subunit [Proteobacteria bacterium]|nr:ABC transporter permease subunit [Pseudomonadota bacterium]MBU1639201.1 ABC transporter permease subunit [Pseudomonadota bacterium]